MTSSAQKYDALPGDGATERDGHLYHDRPKDCTLAVWQGVPHPAHCRCAQ